MVVQEAGAVAAQEADAQVSAPWTGVVTFLKTLAVGGEGAAGIEGLQFGAVYRKRGNIAFFSDYYKCQLS